MSIQVFNKLGKNKLLLSVVFAFVITLLFSFISSSLSNLNSRFTDGLYGKGEISEDIIIIAIDSSSTQNEPEGLGIFNHWTRMNYVEMLSSLSSEKPSILVFDILFSSSTSIVRLDQVTSGEVSKSDILVNSIDKAFEEALASFNSKIILPFRSDYYVEGKSPVFPLNTFSAVTHIADHTAEKDPDTKIRRVLPHFTDEETGEEYDNFALKIAKEYLGVDELDLKLEDGKMLINFFGPAYSYQMIPFIDVYNGDFEEGIFKDKIVLVGVTDFKQNQDSFATPTSGGTLMPGVEIWANAIQTILDEKFLVNQSALGQALTIFTMAFLLTAACFYLGSILSVVALVFAFAGFTAFAHMSFSGGVIVNMINPYLAMIATFVLTWMYRYFVSDRSKREITSAFGHYVSSELVSEISKNPDMVKLGGERKVVTVLFSDVKSSTTYSETVAIEAWVTQINEYFTAMESVVQKSGGTLDKYEGDAIMAFWNAPVSQENHIARAYAAALGMQNALKQLHAKWQKEGKPLIEFRVGINSGEAIVGNFGSVNRFDYTVMGDTVNTASRLESAANKTYATKLIVSGFEKYLSAEDVEKFFFRQLDTVYLPGKNEPVVLYELLALGGNASSEMHALKQVYEAGLQHYRVGNYDAAIIEFSKLPADEPSKILLARCQLLKTGAAVSGLDENKMYRIMHK